MSYNVKNLNIRPILPRDNHKVGQLIQQVLEGEGAPKEGTAYADKDLFKLSEIYQFPKCEYFVVEKENTILGGAGVAPLAKLTAVCELQKMYILKEARGKGVASQLMECCLEFARKQHFESCYIETLPSMKAAQNLYLNYEFDYIDLRLGDTGHFSCDVWMLKEL